MRKKIEKNYHQTIGRSLRLEQEIGMHHIPQTWLYAVANIKVNNKIGSKQI